MPYVRVRVEICGELCLMYVFVSRAQLLKAAERSASHTGALYRHVNIDNHVDERANRAIVYLITGKSCIQYPTVLYSLIIVRDRLLGSLGVYKYFFMTIAFLVAFTNSQ